MGSKSEWQSELYGLQLRDPEFKTSFQPYSFVDMILSLQLIQVRQLSVTDVSIHTQSTGKSLFLRASCPRAV